MQSLPQVQTAQAANRNMRPLRDQPAFSLLELIIVLVVMIGMMAIVWPNLQRPLSRTTLSEAAQILRDAIDESRYQASVRGVPQFVHLSQGQSEFESGTFDAFLSAESSFNGRLDVSQVALNSTNTVSSKDELNNGPVKSWRLPPTVVISRVHWTLDLAEAKSFEPNQETTSSSDDATTATTSITDVRGEVVMEPIDDSIESMATDLQWWLPFSATGQGRDARIELFDNSIEQSLTVTYEAATGALEISK